MLWLQWGLGGWGLGVRGSLVQSGWRVMAVRCGFQCGAAGWHSDEDNDVLVSHRITECGGLAWGEGGVVVGGAAGSPPWKALGRRESKRKASAPFSVCCPPRLGGAPAKCKGGAGDGWGEEGGVRWSSRHFFHLVSTPCPPQHHRPHPPLHRSPPTGLQCASI